MADFDIDFSKLPGITEQDVQALQQIATNLARAERYAKEGKRDLAVRQMERCETKILLLDMAALRPHKSDVHLLAAFEKLALAYVELAQKLGVDVKTDLYVFSKRGKSLHGW